MRRRKEKLTITIENYRRTFVQVRLGGIRTNCEVCPEEIPMITTREAAAFLKINIREIFRRLETGAIHFAEIENGELLVCTKSLEDFPPNECKRI